MSVSFTSPTPSQTVHENSYTSPLARKEALRIMYNNAQALQSDINVKTIENLELMINEVDVICNEATIEEKVKDQGEVILDSEIMSISSNVLKKCSLSLNKNINSYDANELAEKIKNFICRLPDTISPDEPHWPLLGREIMKNFQRTPLFSMLLGTLQPIPKREIIRRKVVREAQAPIKRPEKVIALEQVEDNVKDTVVEIKKIIHSYYKEHRQPVEFFRLVLHPTDFGKTIENILHVSFLVRDAMVEFSLNENGIPQLRKRKTEQKTAEDNRKEQKNIQNVISLTPKQWKDLVKAYSITEPMIDLSNRTVRRK